MIWVSNPEPCPIYFGLSLFYPPSSSNSVPNPGPNAERPQYSILCQYPPQTVTLPHLAPHPFLSLILVPCAKHRSVPGPAPSYDPGLILKEPSRRPVTPSFKTPPHAQGPAPAVVPPHPEPHSRPHRSPAPTAPILGTALIVAPLRPRPQRPWPRL